MSEEFDTSWFDLKNYEGFKTMTAIQWSLELQDRACMRDHNSSSDRLKTTPVFMDYYLEQSDDLESWDDIEPSDDLEPCKHIASFSFDTSSVFAITNLNVFRDAANLPDVVITACEELENSRSMALKEYKKICIDEETLNLAHYPFDLTRSAFSGRQSTEATIAIDLQATDEQIRNDFNHWLINYRKEIDYIGLKKIYTQKDFDRWIEFSVIPYLDLTLIAKHAGKKITKNKMAKLIFPNEYEVDRVERVRKVTEPMAKLIIEHKVMNALWKQL